MTTQISKTSLPQTPSLYNEDFLLWIEQTIQSLKNREFDAVDWEHLLEEIVSLGRAQKHKVESYLWQLLVHLLLYRYWEQEKVYCAGGWEDEIAVFRFQLNQLTQLTSSKTLYNYLLDIFEQTYSDARKRVIQKTKLPADTFPRQCPFTVEQVLSSDYLPTP